MSYYGYQQRVKADQKAVDYGVIQKDINTAFENIQEEQSIKKEKRETDIASLRTEVSKELEAAREAARTNKGDDTFNAQVLQMANQSAQHMRALEQLLRAGKINPTDFAVQRQNLTDSVTQLKVVTSAYKESVNQALTRQEEGIAGGLEAMNMTEVQSIIDLKNHQLMIDPVSGMVRMHDDVNGTSEGIGDVQIRMMNKYDKYDLTDGLSKYAESVGAITIDENGVKTDNPAAEVAGLDLEDTVRTQWLEGLDVNQQASILSDNSGKDYKYFQADSEADVAAEANRLGINRDDLIWVKKNNGGRLESTLTDTQKDTASDLAMKGLRTMLGYERTVDAPKAQTRDQRQSQEDTDVRIENINMMRKLYRGNASQKSGVLGTYSKQLDAMVPKGYMLQEAKVSKDGLVISYYDPEYPDELIEKTIPADTSSEDAFVKSIGPALTGDDNLLSVLDEAGESEEGDFYDETGTLSVKRTVEYKAGQELIDWPSVFSSLPKMDSWYASNPNKKDDAFAVIDAYVSVTGIEEFSAEMVGDDLVMTLEGFPDEKIEDFYSSDTKKVRDDLTSKLRKIHNQAQKDVSTKKKKKPY